MITIFVFLIYSGKYYISLSKVKEVGSSCGLGVIRANYRKLEVMGSSLRKGH